MKQKILFSTLLIALLLAPFCYKSGLRFVVAKALTYYIEGASGATFCYKRRDRVDGGMEFYRPKIVRPDGTPELSGDRLIVTWNFPLSLNIVLEGGKVETLSPWMIEQTPSLIPITLSVKGAKVISLDDAILDFEGSVDPFSVNVKSTLDLGPFGGIFQFQRNNKNIEIAAEGLDLQKMDALMSSLNLDVQGYSFREGRLDGTIALSDETWLASVELNDTKIENRSFGLQANLGRGTFKIAEDREEIAIEKPLSLVFLQEGAESFRIEGILGLLNQAGDIFFTAKSDNHAVTVQGKKGKESLDLQVLLDTQENKCKLELSSKLLSQTEQHITFAATDFSAAEFHAAAKLLTSSIPELKIIEVNKGSLDFKLELFTKDKNISRANMEQILLKELVFEAPEFNLSGNLKSAAGAFSLNAESENLWDSLDGTLSLDGGRLDIHGWNNKIWTLDNFQTELNVNQGVFEKSLVTGEFQGLKSLIGIDWKEKGLLTIDLSGPLNGVEGLFSHDIYAGIQKGMKDDHLLVRATAHSSARGAKVEGALEIYGQKGGAPEEILFGFDLERRLENLWVERGGPQLAAFWKDGAKEALQELLPPILRPAILFESNWMHSEAGLFGLVLRNGWFFAKELPLEKYIAPFAFSDGASLQGVGNFKGSFDHKRLSVDYDAYHVVLDNPVLTIDVKCLENASHFVDFERGLEYGIIPIQEGTYFEKESGLLFTGVAGTVHPQQGRISSPEIRAVSNGLEFVSGIDLDLKQKSLGKINVQFFFKEIRGSTVQAADFFRHFSEDNFLLDLPFEGDLALDPRGGQVVLTFDEGRPTFDAKIHGRVEQKRADLAIGALDVSSFSVNFSYYHQERLLILSQGSIKFLGKGDELLEIVLNEGEISDCLKGIGWADFSLKQNECELLSFSLEGVETANNAIQWSVRPTEGIEKLTIALGADRHLSSLEFCQTIDCRSLWEKMEAAAAIFEIPLHRFLPVHGEVSGKALIKVSYEPDKENFTLSITSDDLMLEGTKKAPFSFKGGASKEHFTISELSFKDVLLSFEANKVEGEWHVPFVGLEWKKGLTVAIEEGVFSHEGTFSGRIKTLEVNSSNFGEFPFVDQETLDQIPALHMMATGKLELSLKEKTRGLCTLDGKFDPFSIEKIPFEGSNFKLVFSTEEGVTLFDTAFRANGSSIVVERCHVDPKTFDIELEKGRFSIPKGALGDLQTIIDVDLSPLNRIQGEVITGELQFDRSGAYAAFSATLPEGNILAGDSLVHFKDLTVEKDPFDWKIFGGIRPFEMEFSEDADRGYLWFTLSSFDKDLKRGELVITEAPKKREGALVVDWERDPAFGVSIIRALGNFSGLHLDLVPNGTRALVPDALFLTGSVRVDPKRAFGMISSVAKEGAKNNGMGSFSLDGDWKLDKETGGLFFEGMLLAEGFSLKGYEFNLVTSEVKILPDRVVLSELFLQDDAGEVTTPLIELSKLGKEWQVACDQASVVKFRPSLLKDVGKERGLQKDLLIREISLQQFTGPLGEPSLWKGKGRLSFQAKNKQKARAPLFQIPQEVLSRIGLDTKVLQPIAGHVDYRIEGGKVWLVKFRDMYSEGKLSKFFLAGKSNPSYIDFDGNMNVNVRMKQYNLVFKLAELLTVRVQGTLTKPSYAFGGSSSKKREREIAERDEVRAKR